MVAIVVVVVLTVATPFLAIGAFVIGFIVSLIADYMLANAFPSRPNAPGAPRPTSLDGASGVFSAIIAFMALFVHGIHGSHTNPEHAFWWGLGGSVLSMGSLFASWFGFAKVDKSGKTAAAISLVGSILSFTMSVAYTLVVGFAEDRYGLAVLSTIFSGVSLFTSAYGLAKSSFKTPDVLVLSAISTALSFGSLAISLWTLF